jgi:ElaB/YqjD/DUF883 family membrane-anchored ribosome-binding protein
MRTTIGNGSNGGKHPNEILAEIDRTRDEMDRTLAAIEQRLTPGQLVDQGLDYLRQSGANEFVQNLGGAAKQNPMPVAVTAIGLAWLMALGRQPAQPNYGPTSSSGLREGMSSMRDKASGMMHSASDTLSSARGSMSDTMNTARDQWQRARSGIDSLVNEQPLALGAIGLAIGAILGAAAPRTRLEEQTMGEASRNLTEKAKEVGSQKLDQATQAAKQAAEKRKEPDKKGAW